MKILTTLKPVLIAFCLSYLTSASAVLSTDIDSTTYNDIDGLFKDSETSSEHNTQPLSCLTCNPGECPKCHKPDQNGICRLSLLCLLTGSA